MTRRLPTVKDLLPKLSDVLDLLTMDEHEQLLKDASVHVFRKNELIYNPGDKPTHLHCLLSGKVKICKDGVGGRTQIVRVIRPVEYFGYRPAFAGENYVSYALAFENSTIVRIPMDEVIKVVKGNARLSWFFINRLATDLGRADERTVSLTQKHIRGRLADALLFLKESYGVEEDGFTLSIYLSREDLANLSNMTTSNAIRTLSAFAAERLVAVDGRKVKLLDIAKLEKISRIG
ncbi:MAG: Crp/Fnr family transcriptional regulator [Bacteroidaceae bacterium]|nr:Crp/Fnr family transcriptional regulator [Bacteroidaceae bacterium]